jgi:hypothetical protein
VINDSDVYRYTQQIPLVSGKTQIGVIFADYEIIQYTNVRNLTSTRCYMVTCKQRIVVPNSANLTGGLSGLQEMTQPDVTSYTYPIMLQTGVGIACSEKNAQVFLLDYTPKTINTSVNISSTDATTNGTSTSNSSEKSSGRSVSDTNSYEVSGSVGFFGDLPMGQIGGSYGHSKTTSSYSSASSGNAVASDRQSSVSGSNSMSIKDWGAYSCIASASAPTWMWAQEYPWDVTQYHTIPGGTNSPAGEPSLNGVVTLPDFVQSKLVNQTNGYVYPPSHLSLYGVNFLETAQWLVQMPETYCGTDETLTFTHKVTCVKATHAAGTPQSEQDYDTTGQPIVSAGGEPVTTTVYPAVASLTTMAEFSYTSGDIDMVKLALNPITDQGANNGAVVGFVLSQFLAVPPASTAAFRITSAANNILVSGTGFNAPINNDSPITANLSAGPVTLNIYFKIVDFVSDLSLFLRHWTSNSASLCCIELTINGLSPIYRHVDTQEYGGGSDNVMTVVLRNQDFASADFYDYLVMGLNTISITVSASYDPDGTTDPGVYSLRALAIG